MHEGLPAICFIVEPSTKKVVVVKKGESGYYSHVNPNLKGGETAREMNWEIGVTPAQAEAMFVGSMFGWDVPGANPDIYDDDGKPIRKSNHPKQGKN